jgi:ATP-dependent Clp protease protease subunit
VAAQLKGSDAVTVNINSPGGNFFEGIAIYNVLRAHPGRVTVNIMGMAASAASIVAMAGDEIRIARAGFLMIHNAWCVAMGDRHDMADSAEFLAPFDAAMAEVYAARTGMKVVSIAAMLDNETWISGEEAVTQNFADSLLPADQVVEDAKAKAEGKSINAVRAIDAALAAQGRPRSERRGLIRELRNGMPGAAASESPMPGAGLLDVAASLRRLTTTIKR